MKQTNLQPTQIKRKINSLLQKKKELVMLEKKIEKIHTEIETVEYELSECFSQKESSTKEGDLL
jgi:valyl-tRNA synthetase